MNLYTHTHTHTHIHTHTHTHTQVEASLRQRCEAAEKEARTALEKERTARDRHSTLHDALASAEARVSALQQEASRLSAELREAKASVMDAQQTVQDVTAQIQVEKNAVAKKSEEIADAKALLRRKELEHVDALAQARKEAEEQREALTGRVKTLEAAVQAAKTSQTDTIKRPSREGPPGSNGEHLWGSEGGVDQDVNGAGGSVQGEGAGGDGGAEREVDPWERRVAADVSLYTPGESVYSSAAYRQEATGKASALQRRCDALESERCFFVFVWRLLWTCAALEAERWER